MTVYIFYAYYETPSSKDNLSYFLEHGYIDNPDYVYCIVVNGRICSIPIPKELTVIHKDNLGYDFGAWSEGFKHFGFPNTLSTDDRVIMINSSIKGPFMNTKNVKWTDRFIQMVNNDVKLAGISINCFNSANGFEQVYEELGCSIINKYPYDNRARKPMTLVVG